MSDWKKGTCERCLGEYDAKENAMGALGGHSPNQCIQSLKIQLELKEAERQRAVLELEYKEIVCGQHVALVNHLSAGIESCPCKVHHAAEAEKHKQLTLDALAEAAKKETP